MAYWKFSDDTVLRTGALVEGYSAFAHRLRAELFNLAFGGGPLVWLAQGEKVAVALDPHSNWLLEQWANSEAKLAGLEVCETNYILVQDDIPPELAEGLRRRPVAT